MGAWGPGVFSNDTAADARDAWRQALLAREDPAAASERIIRQLGGRFHETDFWTGLAAAQHETGHLQDVVRDRALAIIAEGGDLELWEEAGQRGVRERVLQRLAAKLRGPQPAPKTLRRPAAAQHPDVERLERIRSMPADSAHQKLWRDALQTSLDRVGRMDTGDLSTQEAEMLAELRRAAEAMLADHEDDP